jgi:hypothetical protein
MKCPRCQHENHSGAKFCEECASRAAIERAPRLGSTVRDVTCTTDQACDMLDYFSSAADALTRIGDPDAPFCARARDILQNALRVTGITCAGGRVGKVAQ